MTEDRPYRRGMPLDEAVDEIRRGAGRMFDPDIVRDMLSLRAALPALLDAASALANGPANSLAGDEAHGLSGGEARCARFLAKAG